MLTKEKIIFEREEICRLSWGWGGDFKIKDFNGKFFFQISLPLAESQDLKKAS